MRFSLTRSSVPGMTAVVMADLGLVTSSNRSLVAGHLVVHNPDLSGVKMRFSELI
jgi:hypothetical protein